MCFYELIYWNLYYNYGSENKIIFKIRPTILFYLYNIFDQFARDLLQQLLTNTLL